MFRSCLQHCWYSCRAWSLIECRCGAVMSGGSGTGYPVMNRRLRCAQTGRSERKRGMEEAQTAGENKTILLVQGRRGGVFFSSSFFSCRCKLLFRLSCEFSVELHHLLRTRQLGAGLGVKVCLLSTFCHEKRKTAKRAFVGRTPQISKILRVWRWMDSRKNQKNLSETVNV